MLENLAAFKHSNFTPFSNYSVIIPYENNDKNLSYLEERIEFFHLSFFFPFIIRFSLFAVYFATFPIWDGIVETELENENRATYYGRLRAGTSLGQIVISFLIGISLEYTTTKSNGLVNYWPAIVILCGSYILASIAIIPYKIQLNNNTSLHSIQVGRRHSDLIRNESHQNNEIVLNQVNFNKAINIENHPKSIENIILARKESGEPKLVTEKGNLCKSLRSLSFVLKDIPLLIYLFFSFLNGVIYGAWDNFAFRYLKDLGSSELLVNMVFANMVAFEVIGISYILYINLS